MKKKISLDIYISSQKLKFSSSFFFALKIINTINYIYLKYIYKIKKLLLKITEKQRNRKIIITNHFNIKIFNSCLIN